MACRCTHPNCSNSCGCRSSDRPCYPSCGCQGRCSNSQSQRLLEKEKEATMAATKKENEQLKAQLSALLATPTVLSLPSTPLDIAPAAPPPVTNANAVVTPFNFVPPVVMIPDTPQHRFWSCFSQAWTAAVRQNPNPFTFLLHPQVKYLIEFRGSICGTHLRRESTPSGDSRIAFCNLFVTRPLCDVAMRDFQNCDTQESPVPALRYSGPCGLVGAAPGEYTIVTVLTPEAGSFLVLNIMISFIFPMITL